MLGKEAAYVAFNLLPINLVHFIAKFFFFHLVRLRLVLQNLIIQDLYGVFHQFLFCFDDTYFLRFERLEFISKSVFFLNTKEI